jgi:CPA2 family monovalent cation:H+ antiporter-2
MEEISILRDLVIILAVSLGVVYVFLRLKQSTIVGFIIAGVLIGPSGLSLISSIHQVEVLAEIGVILLLFTIGLEFSFKKLNQMREMVFIGGECRFFLP